MYLSRELCLACDVQDCSFLAEGSCVYPGSPTCCLHENISVLASTEAAGKLPMLRAAVCTHATAALVFYTSKP